MSDIACDLLSMDMDMDNVLIVYFIFGFLFYLMQKSCDSNQIDKQFIYISYCLTEHNNKQIHHYGLLIIVP